MFHICHLARASELEGVRFSDTWTACPAKVDGMRPGDVWRMAIAGSRVAQIRPACMRVETYVDGCSSRRSVRVWPSTHPPIPQVATPSFDCYSLRKIFTFIFSNIEHRYFLKYIFTFLLCTLFMFLLFFTFSNSDSFFDFLLFTFWHFYLMDIDTWFSHHSCRIWRRKLRKLHCKCKCRKHLLSAL